MLFTDHEKKVIKTAMDFIWGPGYKKHMEAGLNADRLDKISLREMKDGIMELAQLCTSRLLEMDDTDPYYDNLRVYNAIHASVLLKIESALDDDTIADLDFFDHPLWDKL